MVYSRKNYKFAVLRTWLAILSSLAVTASPIVSTPAAASSCTPTQVLSADSATSDIANLAQSLVESGMSQVDANAQVAHDFCLTSVQSTSAPGIMPMAGSNGSVTLTAPSVFYDSATKMYYSLTGWNWNDTSYLSEMYPLLNTTENNGNPEAFSSIVYGTPLVISSTLTYGDKGCYFGATSDTSPDGNSNDGFLYKIQDKVRNSVTKMCYNVSTGQMSMQIQNPTKCTDIQLRSKYVHTWNSASIGSWTLSNTGITITVNNVSSSWTSASNNNTIFTIC